MARYNSATNLLYYDVFAPRLRNPVAALNLDSQTTTDFSSDFRLEKPSGTNRHELFQLVHKKMYADGRTGK